MCSKTSSGLQCAECPLFRDWVKRKKDHHAVKQALPLENHTQEVHNIQSDFIDIEGKKKIIDKEMRKRLNRANYRIYKMLIIKGMTEREVGETLGGKQNRLYPSYQTVLAARKLFVKVAKEIIDDFGLVD